MRIVLTTVLVVVGLSTNWTWAAQAAGEHGVMDLGPSHVLNIETGKIFSIPATKADEGTGQARGSDGACPEGEIADCNGHCAPAWWVGDGWCDDGTYSWNGNPIVFNCEQFNWDEGDCDDGCSDGEIEDCNGNCCPWWWLGDGWCDDGTYSWNGNPIVLDCEEYNWDEGDCESDGECPDGEIADCNGHCAPAWWVGDGWCDDGTYSWNGNPIEFNCEDFNWDEGDCDDACPDGEIEDCNGNCCPWSWVGDGWCDDGTYSWNGNAIDLMCEEYNWDEGDCKDDGECPDGEILDCNGHCCPADWVGDGWCDDGTYSWNGNPIDLMCEEYDFDGGDCDTNGACCFGADYPCEQLTQAACEAYGGEYQGDDSSCEGDPCGAGLIESIGICCIQQQGCVLVTRGACEFKMGGRYMGDGTTCDDAPCDPLCAGDINRDGVSNVEDLLAVLGGYGAQFDVDDLLVVLGDFGCSG